MQRKSWCQARAQFDMAAERATPGSIFSSPLCERMCRNHIPGYDSMPAEQQSAAALQFLLTGQCCAAHQMEGKLRTILLILEQGADAFQPFKRRDHSTWVLAFRCAVIRELGGTLCRGYRLTSRGLR